MDDFRPGAERIDREQDSEKCPGAEGRVGQELEEDEAEECEIKRVRWGLRIDAEGGTHEPCEWAARRWTPFKSWEYGGGQPESALRAIMPIARLLTSVRKW